MSTIIFNQSTNNFPSVDFPLPILPTNAIFSFCLIINDKLLI